VQLNRVNAGEEACGRCDIAAFSGQYGAMIEPGEGGSARIPESKASAATGPGSRGVTRQARL
jgi:hypothetical protein